MEIRELARFLEKTQYLPEEISFKNDWLGWKLAYCDALLSMHESEKEVVRNLAKSVIDHKHHKLVFRGSGNVFCTYVYAFVNDEDEPELPFYMLNRNEIFSCYDDFLERLEINEERGSIILRADGKIYEFSD